MAVLKCKMCGGDLKFEAGTTICECEYCGSKQTIPSTDDEKRLKLYERANRLRFDCEFDKAAGVYESIVAEYQEEAEAYWGLVLCKYGIEYVDDPATGNRVPTCHRSSFESVMDDSNFEQVMENSDTLARGVYREEAKKIEEIRKGIITISSTEEPYDIFICYKETAEDGQRTIDSVIAQDVYDALTEKGYRVFFSRITLEDKLGQEYEPYIFAALNSAKVMLAFGTTYDYYNAVWVRNEWSRFLQLIAAGQKKTLIPCYKDLDAYDMPKEFKHLQAQDMGKVGAIQDLVRGVNKILGRDRVETVQVQYNQSQNGNVEQLLKRGQLALEDSEWTRADEFFEEALNQDAENAHAYLGKWLAKLQRSDLAGIVEYYENLHKKVETESLEACPEDEKHISDMATEYEVDEYLSKDEIRCMYKFSRTYESQLSSMMHHKNQVLSEFNSEKLYLRTKQYATDELLRSLQDVVKQLTRNLDCKISEVKEEDKKKREDIELSYASFVSETDAAVIQQYNGAKERLEKDYSSAIASFESANSLDGYRSAKSAFQGIRRYKESAEYIKKCDAEIDRLQKEQSVEIQRKRDESKRLVRKWIAITGAILFAIVVALTVRGIHSYRVFSEQKKASEEQEEQYKKAVSYYQSMDYEEAKTAFDDLAGYKESDVYKTLCEVLLGERGMETPFAQNIEDSTVFQENTIIKDYMYLEGTWKCQKGFCNGHENKLSKGKEFEINQGKLDGEYELYYRDGGFRYVSENKMEWRIVEYEGNGDSLIAIEQEYDDSASGEHLKWVYRVSKE